MTRTIPHRAPAAETGLEIAIVGMAGRFPGAGDLRQLWRNLRDGVESISFFSDQQLLAAGHDPAVLRDGSYVKAKGVLADAELFDAEFFGYSPREAEILDPQQRLFLECCWQALEDAGQDPLAARGPVGVYGGVAKSSYALNLLSQGQGTHALGRLQTHLAVDKDYLCTRVSYKLDLEGPSVVVQSACSTSLVAVHLAVQALLAGECGMALAGGVAVSFPQESGYHYQRGGVGSPDGHCRAFDEAARGVVGGHGVGVVVLKRLADARADGDAIRAVIKGSAINNDGGRKAGYTAPRQDGQRKVVLAALQMAEVDAADVSYVEAHGTGTELGDPIEVTALCEAFRAHTDRRGYCALGSVKTNLGHLDTAAGIVSLIKTVLSLEHEAIPPSLHFTRPNPEIDFAGSPFFVNTRLTPWPRGERPRRAAVSSFGVGGTNAHLVLEEAPPPLPARARRDWQVVPLSARTEAALEAATANLAEHLRGREGLALADVAYTCQVGRRHFDHRRAVVARGPEEAAAWLERRDGAHVLTGCSRGDGAGVAFLFPGLGEHYPGMGRGLLGEPAFAAAIDRCAELFAPHLGTDLRQLLYPPAPQAAAPLPAAAGAPPPSIDLAAMLGRRRGEAETPLRQTAFAQPALFAVEYALASLWTSWGVTPTALIGYSLGEYVAACLAGVLSLADAAALVAGRARLIQGLPAGSMLAVPLGERDALARCNGGLSLAAVMGDSLSVVAGEPEAVAALAARLAAEQLVCRPLATEHAFHSTMMEPIAERFAELVRNVALHPPRVPCLSNVTGTWLTPEEATDPGYFVRHLRQTVRLADAFAELCRGDGRLLLEVGPGKSLGSVLVQQGGGLPSAPPAVLSSLRHEYERQEDLPYLLRALARLWMHGAAVDWTSFHGTDARPRRVPLPTYPFERRRYFVERRPATKGSPAAAATAAAPAGKLPDLGDWFHAPTWKLAVAPDRAADAPPAGRHAWLLLLDASGLGARLLDHLRDGGQEVVAVTPGERFHRLGPRAFALRPTSREDFASLLAELPQPPDRIVHLWQLTGRGAAAREPGTVVNRGIASLVALAQALGGGSAATGAVELTLVADGLCPIERGDLSAPEKATLFGPARVLPREYPNLRCRMIDVDGEEAAGGLARRLAAELSGGAGEPLVALRGERRWVPAVEAVRLGAEHAAAAPIAPGGVYLITGGLGGIGLALARHLAVTARAKLALLGRSGLPPRAHWTAERLAETDLGRRIRAVEELEELGAEVLVLAADVAAATQMGAAVAAVRERWGRLDGVFHAAGVPGGGLVAGKTLQAIERVLAPKLTGTLVLERVLAEHPEAFLALFSSLAWLHGEPGQVDYCAANAFLGAYAQHCRRQGGPRQVVAIDWCQWQWNGWAEMTRHLDERLRAELDRRRREHGLTFDEGMEALRRAMGSGLPQLMVSTRPLPSAAAGGLTLHDLVEEMEQAPAPRTWHPRPSLGVAYEAPRGELERQLAELWQPLLGIEQVGVYDDFFDLGGHSLLGIQLLSRVRETLQVDLPLRVLFETPTLAGMAAAIAERRAQAELDVADTEPGFPAVIDPEMLAGLDHLSDQELDGLLAEMQSESEGSAL
jgi:acyl transferase domain-containing protein